MSEVRYQMYTMCMVQRDGQVLLINRPDEKGFPGYIAPGGKVEYPESIVAGAIREVREETGLEVAEITYKGLYEYCEPKKNLRYMVYNYLATAADGELLSHPPEGEPLWVLIEDALGLPMQDWFRSRFPLFFDPGTFELHIVWDTDANVASEENLVRFK